MSTTPNTGQAEARSWQLSGVTGIPHLSEGVCTDRKLEPGARAKEGTQVPRGMWDAYPETGNWNGSSLSCIKNLKELTLKKEKEHIHLQGREDRSLALPSAGSLSAVSPVFPSAHCCGM